MLTWGTGPVSVVSLTPSWAGVSPEEPMVQCLGLCEAIVSWRSFKPGWLENVR